MDGNPSDIFKQAKDEFLLSLPPNERSKFVTYNSASEMMENIAAFEKSINERRQFEWAVKKIRKFNGALEPYFAVVDILIQSHPDYAALVWGALRLVLQVSLHFQ
jgi:hypothetical protein